MRRTLAKSAAMSVSRSTPRRTQNDRSLSAGRSAPRSMATKRSSTEMSSKSELSRVDLPVARSPKTISVRRSLRSWASFVPWPPVSAPLSSSPRKVVEITPGAPTSPAYISDVCENSVARRATKCSRYAVTCALSRLRRISRCSRVLSPMRARSSRLIAASISLMSATWTARSAWSRPSTGAAAPLWSSPAGAVPGAPSRGGAVGMSFSAGVMSVHAQVAARCARLPYRQGGRPG